MPIQLSKILVGVQGVLFGGVPAFFLLFFGLMSVGIVLEDGSYVAAALIVLLGASFVSAAVVITRFCSKGAEGLRAMERRWWVLCSIGAALSLLGVYIVALDRQPYVISEDVDFVLRPASAGAPLILTYAHLLLEYYFRESQQHAA